MWKTVEIINCRCLYILLTIERSEGHLNIGGEEYFMRLILILLNEMFYLNYCKAFDMEHDEWYNVFTLSKMWVAIEVIIVREMQPTVN